MLCLNYRDARPIYEQIEDGLRSLIISGAMLPAEKLPSVRELSAELAINPNTIQRAYRELEQDGYIYTVAGKGAYVAQWQEAGGRRRGELLQRLEATCRELCLMGMTRNELAALVRNPKEATQ